MSSGRVGCLLSTRTWLCAWKAAIKNVCLLPRAGKGNAPILSALAWLALGWPWIYPHTHTHMHSVCSWCCMQMHHMHRWKYLIMPLPAWQISWCVVVAGGQQSWWIAPTTTTRKQPWKCHVAFEKCALMRERHIKASSCLGCQANKAGRQHTKMSRPERDRKTKFVYVTVQWKTYCKANRQS